MAGFRLAKLLDEVGKGPNGALLHTRKRRIRGSSGSFRSRKLMPRSARARLLPGDFFLMAGLSGMSGWHMRLYRVGSRLRLRLLKLKAIVPCVTLVCLPFWGGGNLWRRGSCGRFGSKGLLLDGHVNVALLWLCIFCCH